MKRICVNLFALICLIISVSAVSVSAATISYIRGDASGDGVVTITDATVIQRRLVGLPNDSFNKQAADVDGDGLSIKDATFIQMYLAEFENVYNIGETVTVPDPTEPQPTMPQPTTDPYELPFIPNK